MKANYLLAVIVLLCFCSTKQNKLTFQPTVLNQANYVVDNSKPKHIYDGDYDINNIGFDINCQCIQGNQIIVNIYSSMAPSVYYIGIGPNCFTDPSNNYGARLFKNEVETIRQLPTRDGLALISAQFPEGFTPSSYLDYLDYSISIEPYNP